MALHRAVPAEGTVPGVVSSPKRESSMAMAPAMLSKSGCRLPTLVGTIPSSARPYFGLKPCCCASLVKLAKPCVADVSVTWVTPAWRNFNSACWRSLEWTGFGLEELRNELAARDAAARVDRVDHLLEVGLLLGRARHAERAVAGRTDDVDEGDRHLDLRGGDALVRAGRRGAAAPCPGRRGRGGRLCRARRARRDGAACPSGRRH